tara:strand:+ start:3307 stop:4980 length:1674 start_codon:yes stop_codon:yes gene_type:complete
MAGYTRQDTANNIANGNVIDADDFDAEYNSIEAGFNASTGHKHDGTAGEGAPITKVGPAQDLVVSGIALTPKTTNTLDIGTSSVQFKNAWLDGTLDTDALIVSANASVGGTLGVTGVLTATGGVVGAITGNVTGALTGNVTGNVTGDVTGDVTGALTGNVTGDVTGALTGDVTGNITGNVTGDVTGALTGNADTATAWVTARDITLTGDVTGTVSGVNGGGNISIATTVAANSVALGADTTGDYVSSLVAGTGVTLTNNSGETATPMVAIGQAVGTTSDVTFNDATVSGNAIVQGNLTVSGTTTYIDTTTLNIGDNIITLNADEAGTPSANAGIEVERGTEANKTFIWDEAADKWTAGSEAIVAGSFEGPITGAVTGNADTASTLATARNIALDGDVTGTVSFNGSANVSITATIVDDSHNHVISNVDGLQTALNGKEAVDVEILKADTDDNLTAGYTATADDDGTKSSGTYTPAPAGGNLKRIINGGAFTLAAPTAAGDYTLVIQMTNNASAGIITLSGFTRTIDEGYLTTTDGHDFFLFITKVNGFTSLTIQALQ